MGKAAGSEGTFASRFSVRRRRSSVLFAVRERVLSGVASVGAAFGLVSATDVPTPLATVGALAVAGSFATGGLGGASWFLALAAAVACVAVDTSPVTLEFAALSAIGATFGYAVSARLPSMTLIRAVSGDRVTREHVALEERARTELTRARRYERPLSIISFVVEPRGGSSKLVVAAGRAMAEALRVTDFVGVTERGYAVAVLPDTRGNVVSDLLARVEEQVARVGARGKTGYASFPDDAVTWRELTDIAIGRAVGITRGRHDVRTSIDVTAALEHHGGS